MKVCSICATSRELSFYYEGRNTCKLCMKERDRRWVAANPGRRQATTKAWLIRNKAAHALQQREWRSKNKAYLKESKKAYRDANPEKVKAGKKASIAAKPEQYRDRKEAKRKANPEKSLARVRAWCAANPDKKAATFHRRRARKAAVANTLTVAELTEIRRKADGRCHYCGEAQKLTLDHVVPLAKLGPHSADNIVMACKSCNSMKHDGDVFVFMERLLTKGRLAPARVPDLFAARKSTRRAG